MRAFRSGERRLGNLPVVAFRRVQSNLGKQWPFGVVTVNLPIPVVDISLEPINKTVSIIQVYVPQPADSMITESRPLGVRQFTIGKAVAIKGVVRRLPGL